MQTIPKSTPINLPTLLLFSVITAHSLTTQLPDTPPQLSVRQLNKSQRQQISEDSKIIGINLPEVKFQISWRILLQRGTVQQADLFNVSKYSPVPAAQACSFYPTSLDFIMRWSQMVGGDTYRYLVAQSNNKYRIYVVDSKHMFSVYAFDKINVRLLEQHQIEGGDGSGTENESKDRKESKESSNDSSSDGSSGSNMEIVDVRGVLYLFRKDSLQVFESVGAKHEFAKVNGYVPVNKLTGIGKISDQQGTSTIWVAAQRSIFIYQLNANNTKEITKLQQLTQLTQSPLLSAKYQNNTFFLLSTLSLTLYSYPTPASPTPSLTYTLPSSCTTLQLLPTTAYLTCRYEHRAYITQILLSQSDANNDGIMDVSLNQYYDDSFVEGITNVRKIGKNLISLLGDQQILVINEAVHREVLKDLQDSKRRQYEQRFDSFGLFDIVYVDSYSTEDQSNIVLITQTQIKMVTIIYEPPQLQCQFSRQEHTTSVSLLLQFNTTVCPTSTANPNLNPSYTNPPQAGICTLSFPYTIFISEKDEYEYKQANFIQFLALTLLISLIILGVAHSVRIKRNAEKLERHLRMKLERLKKKKQMKELNDINAI